jgi:hypothetical protein
LDEIARGSGRRETAMAASEEKKNPERKKGLSEKRDGSLTTTISYLLMPKSTKNLVTDFLAC